MAAGQVGTAAPRHLLQRPAVCQLAPACEFLRAEGSRDSLFSHITAVPLPVSLFPFPSFLCSHLSSFAPSSSSSSSAALSQRRLSSLCNWVIFSFLSLTLASGSTRGWGGGCCEGKSGMLNSELEGQTHKVQGEGGILCVCAMSRQM